jgi:hypothetical protein
MARTPYPSIPAPGNTLPQLLTSVEAIIQVVRLLSINAQSSTPQTLSVGSGAVASNNIAQHAVTDDGGQVSATSTAACTLTLGVSGDVIAIASYTGTTDATPAGTGELVIYVDGSPVNAIPLSSVGGNVIPATGFCLAPALSAGVHTFTARAVFSTGPTYLNDVSIVAFALMR